MTTTAIKRAVSIAGSQKQLAEAIGVTQSLVSQWCNGAPINTKHFAPIERVTRVTAGELLMDEMAKAAAAAAEPPSSKQVA